MKYLRLYSYELRYDYRRPRRKVVKVFVEVLTFVAGRGEGAGSDWLKRAGTEFWR